MHCKFRLAEMIPFRIKKKTKKEEEEKKNDGITSIDEMYDSSRCLYHGINTVTDFIHIQNEIFRTFFTILLNGQKSICVIN